MALSAGCHLEVRTTGSDTICSGAFDPTQTAGMFTDGAATSANTAAPVFSSASYNFVAGDVGAYVFIGAGTNWTKGWYVIASVASNQATLTATASGYQAYSDSVNTSAGCASVASPTGATWSIDYSQQAAAEFTCTDGTAAGAGSTLSSATIGFGSQMVGNAVRITAGTNCTTGHHVITSVAAGVATFNNAVTTGVTSNCTLYLGGALATPGYAGASHVAGNSIWIAAGTYNSTSASNNVANGRMTLLGACFLSGYSTVRGDVPRGASRPLWRWGVNAGSTFLVTNAGGATVESLIFDGRRDTYTNTAAVYFSASQSSLYNCKIMSCSVFTGLAIQTGAHIEDCEITDIVGTAYGLGPRASLLNCYIHDNNVTTNMWTIGGTTGVTFTGCIFDTNTTPITNLNSTTAAGMFSNCVFYSSEATVSAAVQLARFSCCIFMNSLGYAIATSGVYPRVSMHCCAFYNNTSGNYSASNIIKSIQSIGEIALTADPFVDAANGDFRLNMKAGGGALLRGAGYPQTFPGLTWAHRRDIGAHQHSGSRRGING